MKSKITTVLVVGIAIFLIIICKIDSVVIVSSGDTFFLQGYAIGIITHIAYMSKN